MKVNLTYELKKRFEDHAKVLRKASKKSAINRPFLAFVAMDLLHVLIDNIEDEKDSLQLEESFDVLLKLASSEVEKAISNAY